jgi:glycosyltransferase involved in cell wall biosynthesis
MAETKFTILITTKNRINDLKFTLDKLSYLINRKDVKCIICDDGSTDNTNQFIKQNHPQIQLISNVQSKGLIYSRNKLMSLVDSEFAISLDDDLHFITENPLEIIQDYFDSNTNCGLISFRIFWSKLNPISNTTSQKAVRMQSFAGGAHVWRMSAWRSIPQYPAWFVFYGEEDFASYHLFKKNIQIHYLPAVLTHHRVDIKGRKKDNDYVQRLRRSLRAGWFLFFLFMPLSTIPKKMAYSIYAQLKLKVFKGDFKVLKAIVLALIDLVINFPKIYKNSSRLTLEEYKSYNKLPLTKLYWNPED